jgi:hypothetical protein
MIARNIYSMKRQFGALILIRRREGAATDPQTGEATGVVKTWLVRRAPILPEDIARNAKQSISLITAQKQMVEGGGFDVGKRVFLIDCKDMPRGFKLQKDDWIVFDSKHYDIDTLSNYGFDAAWVVTGKELVGRVEGMDIHNLSVTQNLEVSDAASQ